MASIAVEPRYFWPAEVDLLIGDPCKARRQVGWRREMGFEALVAEIVAADRVAASHEAHRRGE